MAALTVIYIGLSLETMSRVAITTSDTVVTNRNNKSLLEMLLSKPALLEYSMVDLLQLTQQTWYPRSRVVQVAETVQLVADQRLGPQ